MPRPSKGARLYLRGVRADRDRIWIIRDGPSERSTGCRESDREQAEKALTQYLTDKHSPVAAPKAAALEGILIAHVIGVYLDEKAPLTKSREWIGYMADAILDRIGTKPLSAVNSSLCAAYVKGRETDGVSTATPRHELKVLRAAINYFHGSQFGPLPSVPKVTLPPKPAARVDYFLTRTELAQRIRAARRLPQMRHLPRLLLIGWYSGSRPGTILKLRWVPSTTGGWIDLENGVLHRLARGEVESKKRQSPARIHEKLLPHLRRWAKADAAQGCSYVVHYYGKRIRKLRRSWAAVAIEAGHAKQTGLDGHGKPVWAVPDGAHILRHSCVTWLLQAGVAPFQVSGFTSMDLATLEAVYGHHSPHFMRDVASAHGKRTRAPVSPQKPSSNGVNERQAPSLKLRKQ